MSIAFHNNESNAPEILYKGYLVIAETYENDGDYYATHRYYTSHKEEAHLLLQVANVLKSTDLAYLATHEVVSSYEQLFKPLVEKIWPSMFSTLFGAPSPTQVEFAEEDEEEDLDEDTLWDGGSDREYEQPASEAGRYSDEDIAFIFFEYLRDSILGYSDEYFVRNVWRINAYYIPEDIAFKNVSKDLLAETS